MGNAVDLQLETTQATSADDAAADAAPAFKSVNPSESSPLFDLFFNTANDECASTAKGKSSEGPPFPFPADVIPEGRE